jgi:hypothetical protein
MPKTQDRDEELPAGRALVAGGERLIRSPSYSACKSTRTMLMCFHTKVDCTRTRNGCEPTMHNTVTLCRTSIKRSPPIGSLQRILVLCMASEHFGQGRIPNR